MSADRVASVALLADPACGLGDHTPGTSSPLSVQQRPVPDAVRAPGLPHTGKVTSQDILAVTAKLS
ncbi:hypothetical protein FHS29_006910 [Saccharothrix tamanrassetensis]|uniref:Uncharacterized protein n=1 Tax=Saccharothrix tamanrassetensis TaxID=1051531 RepID=A0A841CW95_9PSEU|nr:hypothetical protein [Saccharothrix tamanrassetensis]